jgi:hypothetical protein
LVALFARFEKRCHQSQMLLGLLFGKFAPLQQIVSGWPRDQSVLVATDQSQRLCTASEFHGSPTQNPSWLPPSSFVRPAKAARSRRSRQLLAISWGGYPLEVEFLVSLFVFLASLTFLCFFFWVQFFRLAPSGNVSQVM